MIKLSVIIVSYNTSSELKQCLDHLFKYPGKHDLEVFVVDNCSSDASTQMVQKNFKNVHLIENQINMGFAAANNQAYQKTTGDYIILLNPDAFIRHGTIDNAVSFMENNIQCGLAGGKLINPQGRLEPSARKFPNGLNKFFTLSGLADKYPSSKIFGKGDFKFFDHKKAIEVDWVPGTFTIYRKKMLEQTLLFDERFFIYYEETDLCLRAKKDGWKVYFTPDAEVVHIGGASAKKRTDLKYDSGGSQVLKFRMRSEYLYFRKNYGIHAVIANAGVELGWHLLRYLANAGAEENRAIKKAKASQSLTILEHGIKALLDTRLGERAPRIPW